MHVVGGLRQKKDCRIADIFDIALPRPRDINSPDLAGYTSQVAAALKGTLKEAVSE